MDEWNNDLPVTHAGARLVFLGTSRTNGSSLLKEEDRPLKWLKWAWTFQGAVGSSDWPISTPPRIQSCVRACVRA